MKPGPLGSPSTPPSSFFWGRVFLGVVVAVCLVQIAWWIYFQMRDSREDFEREMRGHQLVAERLAVGWHDEAPANWTAAQRELPDNGTLELLAETTPYGVLVTLRDSTRWKLAVASATKNALEEEIASRTRMAVGEGGFLVLVVLAAVTAIYVLLGREITRHRQQSQLLSAVTHDFRSPLTAIRLHLQTLQREGVGEEDRKNSVAAALTNLVRLDDLVENVLKTARWQEGRLDPTPQRLDLGTEVGAILTQRRTALVHQRAQVESQFAANCPVNVDPTLLRSLVGNLIENAVKYSPPPAQIHVSVERNGTHAILRVQDRGVGFEPDDAARLFDPFERGRQETDRARPGLGLGLSLVQAITAASGGKVRARSDGPGNGSEFEVRLPLVRESAS